MRVSWASQSQTETAIVLTQHDISTAINPKILIMQNMFRWRDRHGARIADIIKQVEF